MDEDSQEEELHFLRNPDRSMVNSAEFSQANVTVTINEEDNPQEAAKRFLANSKAAETSIRSSPVHIINNPRELNVSCLLASRLYI